MKPPRCLDWTLKGLPARAEGTQAERIGDLGLDLLAEDLMLPEWRSLYVVDDRYWVIDCVRTYF
jgi:hypothetical protein